MIYFFILFSLFFSCKENHVAKSSYTPDFLLTFSSSRPEESGFLESKVTVDSFDFLFTLDVQISSKVLSEHEDKILGIRSVSTGIHQYHLFEDSLIIELLGRQYIFFHIDHQNYGLDSLSREFAYKSELTINHIISDVPLIPMVDSNVVMLSEKIRAAFSDSVMIYLWSSDCSPCLNEMSYFNSKEKNGSKIILLSILGDQKADSIVRSMGINIYFTGKIKPENREYFYLHGFPTRITLNSKMEILELF